MHIERAEAGTFEDVGHFDLAVDTLFAQHRHARTRTGTDERRGDIFVEVEAELGLQARCVEGAGDFTLGIGIGRVVGASASRG
ncbi:hypothetical protein G6F50_015922 [Rhizopus delemar]|uniref:Uncharacterized protein n=1 Tax=Rhizopus delemar TaxID=936053 RepID=A0A9P6XVI8_9FUNG|nr:hypothetical protein G6F50_015922 [Rhizopus delemar]